MPFLGATNNLGNPTGCRWLKNWNGDAVRHLSNISSATEFDPSRGISIILKRTFTPWGLALRFMHDSRQTRDLAAMWLARIIWDGESQGISSKILETLRKATTASHVDCEFVTYCIHQNLKPLRSKIGLSSRQNYCACHWLWLVAWLKKGRPCIPPV